METLLTVRVGFEITLTVLFAVAVQEPFAPITDYIAVVFGFATTTLPADELKLVVGLQV